MPKIRLGKAEEVPPGRMRTYVASGKRVVVVHHGGELRAYENFCPHMGGAMRYDGCKFICGWHGATFDATNGFALDGIAEGSVLPCLALTIEEGELIVDFPEKKSVWADDF